MSDVRAPNYELAETDYMSGMKYKDIAEKYNVTLNTVKSWKQRYDWSKDKKKGVHTNDKKVCTQKVGAPKGNKNAVGNDGGAPLRNDNAVKHGLFEKYLPQETLDIVYNMSLNPLDILWDQIQIAYAAIVRSQSIMHVRDKDDLTKELKRQKESSGETSDSWEKEYELQFAWDKQANFLKAQARAQGELRSMIKQYDELLHNNWEKASEEQKLRISKLRYEVSQLSGGNDGNTGIKDFLKAVKPTEEDIKAMFADEEVNDNAEETEKE